MKQPAEITEGTITTFKTLVNRDVAVPVAAMQTLVLSIKNSNSSTWMELEKELRDTILILKKCRQEDLLGRTSISLGSGCDLFMKYVTRAFNLEYMEFSACKDELLRRGQVFAGMSLHSRAQIARLGNGFVEDGCTVLLHGNSRVVASLILKAAESKQFNIVITEGRPIHQDSSEALKIFSSAGIPVTVVPDMAVGAVMSEIDLCLMGAEGVMENGGIVNKLGTYQIAMVAKALKKPFYVAVESYKFARMYPLSQRDIIDLCDNDKSSSSCSRNTESWPVSALSSYDIGDSKSVTIDFTPAEYITLMFTDLGVLTPAAVSDELIKLYQ